MMAINIFVSVTCVLFPNLLYPKRNSSCSKNLCSYLFPFCKVASKSPHLPKLKFELVTDFTYFFNP